MSPSPDSQRKVNLALAWAWFAFGVFGVVQYALYLHSHPKAWHTTLHQPVAASIPVLFFISVYANFTGHLGTASANMAQVKVDEANVDVEHAEEVNIKHQQ